MNNKQWEDLLIKCGWEYKYFKAIYGGTSEPSGWYLNGKFMSDSKPEATLDKCFEIVIPKLEEILGWHETFDLIFDALLPLFIQHQRNKEIEALISACHKVLCEEK